MDQLLIRVRRSEQMTRDKRDKMAALDIEIERTRARFDITSLLKGLSYEIDFENVDENGQILA